MLRTVTCAASTSKKRNSELPCFVMCPSRRRSPLDSGFTGILWLNWVLPEPSAPIAGKFQKPAM
jgi:hypothetical protein